MADVVLSYSRADEGAARRLAAALKRAGLTVADRSRDVPPDEGPAPGQEIAKAACVVVLWSARAAASATAPQEIKLALSAWADDRLVLAVLDGAPLPAGLRDLAAVDLSPGEAGFRDVVERAKSLVAMRQREAAEASPPVAARPGRSAPSPARGSRRLYAILGAVAVLTALVVAFWPLSPDRVGEMPKGSGPTYAQMGLSPWLFVGGAAILLVLGLIRFLRSKFADSAGKATRASRGETLPADAAAATGDVGAPAPGNDGAHQIFISYSRQDTAPVDRIVEHIEGAGYTVWIDREAAGLGTQRYAAPIVRAIKSARIVALMCSRNAFASDHVVREVYVAGDFRKPFLAFQLDQTQVPDELIYFLSGFPRIPADAVEPEQLRQEIKRFVS